MSTLNLHLAPMPQRIVSTAGGFQLAADLPILLMTAAQPLLFAAQRLQAALNERGYDVPIRAAPVNPDARGGAAIRLAIDPAQVGRREGYKLIVDGEGVTLVGNDPAGAFYGVCTLIQLATLAGEGGALLGVQIPGVQIVDWPDYPNRGVMFDVTRDRVPTMETIYNLVDLLASLKVNQLQLYTEHTFAYQGHEQVWRDASPFTPEEILALDAYCRERFVELVPNQNSFGHMHRWLKFPEYVHLAESPEGIEHSFSTVKEPFSLCPLDPGSIALLDDLYSQLLPHFSSRQFNVGLDETFELGQGRSKAECEARGTGRVYLEFLQKIHRLCTRYGVTMQFWSDIIVRDEPDLVAELPQDVIALEWGYSADYPFAEHTQLIAASGRSFYVCPGTSSWNTLAGRTDNAIANISNAARNGFANGAIGLLNTDWGDNGHPQPLPVSYLGFVTGAAFSWNAKSAEQPDTLDLPAVLDAHIFRDAAGVMGRLAYDLGNIYQAPQVHVSNSSLLFWLLTIPGPLPQRRQGEGTLTPAALEETLSAIETIRAPLEKAQMQRADARLIQDEFAWISAMLHVAARLGLARVQVGLDQGVEALPSQVRRALAEELRPLIDTHANLWLQRSRPGGLEDGLARFRNTLARLEA